MMDPTTLLATGGIAAFVATCWQQVKTVCGYLSSFVVIRAHMESYLGMIMRRHLQTNWKPLPSGMLFYLARFYNIGGSSRSSLVPFRVLSNIVVFRKGWRLIIFNTSGPEHVVLLGIRGAINFDELIRAAALERDAWGAAHDSSRFYVQRVVGRAKQPFDSDSGVTQNKSHKDINLSVSSNKLPSLDLNVDRSFMYERHQYLPDRTDRPFDNLYFSDTVFKYIEQARQWLALGSWYSDRGIPWRRGWVLWGPGGTGKSSLARATAQELGVPVYQYFLSTLNDQEFLKEWAAMDLPCVALFEDFDAVFDKRESLTAHKSLSFDCVLNQISGVSSANGVFLIVTTNHLDKIDPALGVSFGTDGISTRPGRIDTVIHLGSITRENRLLMAQKILRDWPEEWSVVDAASDVTPVQFQEMCLQIAYSKLNSKDSV